MWSARYLTGIEPPKTDWNTGDGIEYLEFLGDDSRRDTEFAESEYFLIKNSLLRDLSASAVRFPKRSIIEDPSFHYSTIHYSSFHSPNSFFNLATTSGGCAITSLANSESCSPPMGSTGQPRFLASAKRSGSLRVLSQASRRILIRSAGMFGGAVHAPAKLV